MELVANCKIINVEEAEDQDAAKQEFSDLKDKYHIVPWNGGAILKLTVDQDIE